MQCCQTQPQISSPLALITSCLLAFYCWLLFCGSLTAPTSSVLPDRDIKSATACHLIHVHIGNIIFYPSLDLNYRQFTAFLLFNSVLFNMPTCFLFSFPATIPRCRQGELIFHSDWHFITLAQRANVENWSFINCTWLLKMPFLRILFCGLNRHVSLCLSSFHF